jgi:predicted ATPase
MADRPSGTVTFLFTDIEGSTRRWEADPEAMRTELAAHDAVLRTSIEANDGWLFKHTGDGVCAAFSAAADAVAAAADAQRSLGLPVRMGIATGEAEQRGDDYFGPALNRAARVMGVGHGGQILVSASTAGLVSGVDLFDLGEQRLRDLSGTEHLFQLRAEGLGSEFPALRTLDVVPGNLSTQSTSFVGRVDEVEELTDLVRSNRLVTLTGVGGVGKTRLALQVAAGLTGEFPDGVWLVELAPVGDPGAVPDAVATALGVTPQAGRSVTDGLVGALSGRTLLLVVDNCEHVLDAAAEFVETMLTGVSTVKVIATSREGLQLGAEQAWTVPSLSVGDGSDSTAVTLFMDRAQAANSGFVVRGDADSQAVNEICVRLDGIALAVELAAARMVSMSPVEVRDRLGDRFRLLSGRRRGLERHQTLRGTVAWSYELLNDDERAILNSCSVFADGFDLAAAGHVNDTVDEYDVLDLLDSLVRKSLVTTEQVVGRTRYGMLETIRQFAEAELAVGGTSDQVLDRHARYFGSEASAQWDESVKAGHLGALEWVDAEFANLRAGFRWSTDQGDLPTAASIAAHTAMLCISLQRYEPVGWAEELLEAATVADLPQLPRLYTAAGICAYAGRPKEAVGYAQKAVALEVDSRYDPFETGWSGMWEALARTYIGQIDRRLEISAELAAQTGFAHVSGLDLLLYGLPLAGRIDEAQAMADEVVTAARDHGHPLGIAFALAGYGQAFASSDPTRALTAFREGLGYSREQKMPWWETFIARHLASLEAAHGDLKNALDLFETSVDSLHRAGNVAHLVIAFANLAVLLDRLKLSVAAATLYGTTRHGNIEMVLDLPTVVEHLRSVLGESAFDQAIGDGAAMEISDAVQYARQQIQAARHELTDTA